MRLRLAAAEPSHHASKLNPAATSVRRTPSSLSRVLKELSGLCNNDGNSTRGLAAALGTQRGRRSGSLHYAPRLKISCKVPERTPDSNLRISCQRRECSS